MYLKEIGRINLLTSDEEFEYYHNGIIKVNALSNYNHTGGKFYKEV